MEICSLNGQNDCNGGPQDFRIKFDGISLDDEIHPLAHMNVAWSLLCGNLRQFGFIKL